MLDAGARLRECARLGLTVQGVDAFNEWFCEHVVTV